MFSVLNPGAIGVAAPDLEATFTLAKKGRFDGIEVDGNEMAGLVARSDAETVKGRFEQEELIPAAFGLPTQWRATDAELEAALPNLARIARACAAIGCRRTCTWIMPCSDEREFADNRRFHVARLSKVARVLHDHGCSFGLEFVGTKTLRDSQRFPFIYQMGPTLEMAREIGPNVGLLLDSWHWYTSGGTVEDIEGLSASDVVYVHVNDAPKGIDRDAQVDSVRSIPASTGVIDGRGFMRALQGIGYDGPIMPEPFMSELSSLASDEERLRAVGEGMEKLFSNLV
ncbi:MAG: sugar phosphate isomerase/epimerase family protein [Fimbriimonadales bacterium]